jgi:hypothetical protein
LKDHDLIASRAYIVMKAADEFKDKTTEGLSRFAVPLFNRSAEQLH